MRGCGVSHEGYCTKEWEKSFTMAAKYVILRMIDSNGQTRWMQRIPTDELPANANTQFLLHLTVTTEWPNNPQLLPERKEADIELMPWGNPYET